MGIRLLGATLAITAVLFAVVIQGTYPVFAHGIPGPGLMPLAALGFIAVGAGGMALAAADPSAPTLRAQVTRVAGAAGLLAAGATYAALMPILGFIGATSAFIAATCLAFGGRRPVILVLSISVPPLLFYAFTGLFNLPLPEATLLKE